MRKIVNELIKKYSEYVAVILILDAESLVKINNMSEEEAKEKLEAYEKIEMQKLERTSNEKIMFYCNY